MLSVCRTALPKEFLLFTMCVCVCECVSVRCVFFLTNSIEFATMLPSERISPRIHAHMHFIGRQICFIFISYSFAVFLVIIISHLCVSEAICPSMKNAFQWMKLSFGFNNDFICSSIKIASIESIRQPWVLQSCIPSQRFILAMKIWENYKNLLWIWIAWSWSSNQRQCVIIYRLVLNAHQCYHTI